MQEQGSPSPGQQQAPILVASGAQDERAVTLVRTLREAGLRVIFADTISIAALLADDAAACVAVLRPDTWKTATIATLLRAKPACLIPVLAEPMELPRGAWTEQALELFANNAPDEQKLLQLLQNQLAKYTTAHPQLHKSEPPQRPSILRLKRRGIRLNVSALVSSILLVLLIIGLGALITYRFATRTSAELTPGSTTVATPHYDRYQTAEPGPHCADPPTWVNQWELGGRYMKTLNGKEVEIHDTSTTAQCRTDGSGTVLSRKNDYSAYSEIFFNGLYGENTLASHYFTQVDATILSGDARTNLILEAHLQGDTYGRYSFRVNALGRWEVSIGSSKDGTSINRLAIGFLPPAKTYTLGLEIDGPKMNFFIDGAQVTSVTDTTYTDNTSLAFGVGDPTATSPASALFAHFEYKALQDLLSPAQIEVTATTTARQTMNTIYSVLVPGYGCDKAGGQWQPLTVANNPGTLHCQTNGMQLIEPGNTDLIAEEDFFSLNGHFPHNYKVSARIDVSAAGTRCAALGTREDSSANTYGSYDFLVCPDGTWAIVLITSSFQTLAQGTMDAHNVYTLTAESNGTAQSLYINGQLMQTVNDSTLSITDHVSLDAGLYTSNQQTSAIFSNFTFTPLP